MKSKIEVLFVGAIIGVYNLLYAPEEVLKNKGDAQIQWIEGTRGWSENGTTLWTGVSPLPSYNVGIGTNTPQYKLDVLGHGRFQGDLYINSWPIRVTSQPSEGYVLKWVGSQGAFIPQPDSGGIGGSGTATQVAFWTSATTIGGSNNLWWDNTNARLGIGTTSPSYKLDVVGSSRIQGDLYINSWPIRVTSQPSEGYVLKWVGSQGAFVPQPDAEHNVYTVQLTQLFVTNAWGSYVDIPGMSITFTPTHNVVYIYVSVMARNADANGYYAQHGQSGFTLKVVNVNTGAMVAKTGSFVTDYDDINGTVTSGSASINGIAVSVTPGQQVTFKLQLMPWALWSNGYIAINPTGVGDQAGDHCVFTIVD